MSARKFCPECGLWKPCGTCGVLPDGAMRPAEDVALKVAIEALTKIARWDGAGIVSVAAQHARDALTAMGRAP